MSNLKKYLFLFGITLFVVGFFYDLLFAGIPPQDAPTHIMEKYNQNAFISDLIIKFGLFVTLIGIVFRIIPTNKEVT